MVELIIGGSGSGKSEYAESRAVRLHEKYGGRLFYIATMKAYDGEAVKKIERHRKMRSGKGFETIECFTGLDEIDIPQKSVALIDCLSNLAANEMFDENGAGESCAGRIEAGLKKLAQDCAGLIIVTNEIFSDGVEYADETRRYMYNLAHINRIAAGTADSVTEVVCGIPVAVKGGQEND